MRRMLGRLRRVHRLLASPELEAYFLGVRQRLELLREIEARSPGARIHPEVTVSGWSGSNLHLAPGSRIEQVAMVALGDQLNGHGELSIGANTWVGQFSNWRLGADCRISIGSDCLIAQFCSFVGVNHSLARDVEPAHAPPDAERKGLTVEDGVWIGAGCTILPGALVRRGAVIGANSVVNATVGAFEIWAGSPARRIGSRR